MVLPRKSPYPTGWRFDALPGELLFPLSSESQDRRLWPQITQDTQETNIGKIFVRAMAQRVPLSDPERAIECLASDGGVILTSFCSLADIDKINGDVAPYIQTILEQVNLTMSEGNDRSSPSSFMRISELTEDLVQSGALIIHQKRYDALDCSEEVRLLARLSFNSPVCTKYSTIFYAHGLSRHIILEISLKD